MKKLLFITALATTVLAGCTSDEQNEAAKQSQPSKIVFNAPIVNGNTRTVYGEQGTKYDPDELFHVYAVWTASAFQNWAGGTKYMDVDVENKSKESASTAKWEPATDYYWPKEGKLSFAAYSPAAAKEDATIEYGANGLSITEFTVRETGKQYDLMYSDRTCDKTESSGGTSYLGVDINFKHALSSIVFKAKTANNYSGTTIRIKKISIYGIYNKGNFKENIKDQAERENEDGLKTEWDTHTGNVEETAPYIAFNETAGKVVTNSAIIFESNAIIALPQVITDNAKVKVEYSIQSSGSTEIEQTKTVDLKDLTDEWKMGYRYTYLINISLTKIYFSPEVEAWKDAAMSSIDL